MRTSARTEDRRWNRKSSPHVNAGCHAPASRVSHTGLRTTLTVALGLALVCAGIVGAGTLADLIPNALAAVCVGVLALLAFLELAVKS